ncbi:hypothetical protein R1flu_010181 [Riccia fluitans]|uniref:Uncharacterized protein n=1 Tax=Riccia fluitans TaxID=41844 RepID=A0ABD1Z5D6_9MARC
MNIKRSAINQDSNEDLALRCCSEPEEKRDLKELFISPKNPTNGYLLKHFKDLFRQTVVAIIMAQFKLQRVTYISDHLIYFLETAIAGGSVIWLSFLRVCMKSQLKDVLKKGANLFSLLLAHYYYGMGELTMVEQTVFQEGHFAPTNKTKGKA